MSASVCVCVGLVSVGLAQGETHSSANVGTCPFVKTPTQKGQLIVFASNGRDDQQQQQQPPYRIASHHRGWKKEKCDVLPV